MKLSVGAAAAAVLCIFILVSVSSVPSIVAALPGGDVSNHQVVTATPVLLEEPLLPKNVRCARVSVPGLSRLKLHNYSSARRINLVPSDAIQEKAYKKIHVCFHSNSSLGLCQCEIDLWEGVQSGGGWSSATSPYDDKYIDVMFVDNLTGFVTVTTKLEFQRWRLILLAVGLSLLLLAPIVSSWVPFYYSSSMAIGICLVVIILLFQGMKLLPTGRKNALYSTLCTFALGAGSFFLNRFSVFVNSILVNVGINQEMHNPVLIFFIVGIVLAGAGFGYWLVCKFVVADDGSVDKSVSQFVKWSLQVIAVTFIFQSTLDTLLALMLLASLVAIYFIFSQLKLLVGDFSSDGGPPVPRTPRMSKRKPHTEFLRPSSRGSL